MAKEELIKFEGVVVDVLPAAMFKVKLDNDHIITATVGGRLRQNNIRILLGDRVDVEASMYDLNKGRIVYRR